jgi:hypothetical protein
MSKNFNVSPAHSAIRHIILVGKHIDIAIIVLLRFVFGQIHTSLRGPYNTFSACIANLSMSFRSKVQIGIEWVAGGIVDTASRSRA